MPNWKRVLVSGSDASLNSLNVTTNVVAQSFTGSLFGTSSWARNAVTASFFSGSIQNAISASYAASASWAINAVTASNVLGGKNNYIPLWSGSSALTSSVIYQTGSNIVIEGSGSMTTSTPTGLAASFNYGSGNYYAGGFSFNYRVYSYIESPIGKIYSPSYATLGADITDNGSYDSFTVSVSWDEVAGASGYRILLYNTQNGYNYDYGADVTTNSYTDDQATNSLFAPNTPLTATLNSVNITGTVNITGSINLNGDNLFTITNDRNIVIGGNGNYYGIGDNVFIGKDAGYGSTNANGSNFIGGNAGYGATNANSSNFIGGNAGYGATNVNSSNFIGGNAGLLATDANSSNFIGLTAGREAINASYSNFIGVNAGYSATNAAFSNFLGWNAGQDATNANASNFLGSFAGYKATNAYYSHFLGYFTGTEAINAYYSNFLGNGAGAFAENASYSTLMGYKVGSTNFAVSSIGSNNIIIGTNITLAPARKDSINIGGILFGSGSYSTTTENAFSGSANGRIGINQPLPIFSLDVSGSGRYTTGLQVTGSLIAPTIIGSLQGTASWARNAVTASFFSGSIANAISASFAATASWAINSLTASYAVRFNVSQSLTASGLRYPTADNGEESFIQTDGTGNLSLQYVKTVYEEMYNGETTTIVKGTPVYISGSVGANARVFRAAAANPLKMPVVYVSADNIASGAVGRGIALGLIKGVDTTGYPAGTEIFVGPSGGWTSTRPTGSAAIQILGYITKEGAGGQGVVLNPGPVNLPNIASGNVWIGNGNSAPIAISSASLFVNSASFALTSSNVLGGATNYVPLWRGATALTSSVMYQSGSNVGIGTILPAYKLDISGDLRTTTDANFATTSGKVGIGTTSPAYKLTINTTAASENIVGIATTSNLLILGINASEGHFINSNTNLAFGAHGSEAIRITSGGNVGIGTKTPTAKLHVTGSTGGIFEVDGVNSINALYVSASGNVGINTITPVQKLEVSGGAKFDDLLVLKNSPFVTGANVYTNGVSLAMGTQASNPYTFTTNNVERMRILANGDVGIGTVSPAAKLQVIGDVVFNSTGTGDGTNALLINNSAGNPVLKIGAAGAIIMNNSTRVTNNNTGASPYLEIYSNSTGNTTLQSSTSYHLLLQPSAGNVGIGTTSPVTPLHISRDGGGSTIRLLRIDNSNVTNSQNLYLDMNTSKDILWSQGSAGGGTFWDTGTRGYGFSINTNRIVTLDQNGNVGVGTTSPQAKLHVTGSTGGIFEVDGVNSINALYVSASGNVGINTITPTEKLTVRGNGAKIRIESESNPSAYFAHMQVNWDASNPFVLNSQGFDILGSKTNIGNVSDRTTYLSSYYDLSLHAGATTTPSSSNARLYISGSGNVGIGTTSPLYRLDVNSGTSGASFRTLSTNTTSNRVFYEATAGNVEQHFLYTGNQDWVLGLDKADSNKFKLSSADDGFASTKVTVTTAGNVGIGTSTPTSKLHVSGGSIFVDNANGSVIVRNGDATNQQQIRLRMSGNDGILDVTRNSGTQPNLIFGTEATERMRITAAGFVGIGTTAPDSELQVGSTATNGNRTIRITDNGYGLLLSGGGGLTNNYIKSLGVTIPLYFLAGNSNDANYIFSSTGRVGIGTTSPNAKLDVNGNTIISGSFTVVTGSAVELQVTNTGVKIGSVPTDNHTVTGSLGITGSLTVNNYTSTGARPLKEVNVSGSIIASNNSTILLDTSTLNSKLLMSYGASNNFPDNYAGFTVDGNRSLRVASNNVEQFIFGWNGNFAAVGFAGIPGSPPARFYAVGAGTTSATKGLQITDVNTKDLFVVYDNGATHMSGSLTVTGSITSYVNFNTQTTNYTLQLGDISKIVEINSGSAATVTVPSSSVVNFPIGSQITIAGYGAGQVSFTTGSSGVNIRSAGNRLRLLQQYSFATITKRGTDEWYLFGDLTV